MDSEAEFIRQTLLENGVDAEVNRAESGPDNRKFIITKKLADTRLAYSLAATDAGFASTHYQARLAIEAENIAARIKDEMTERYSWGDTKDVIVSEYDGGWAKCCWCDDIEEPSQEMRFIKDTAEVSSPSPTMMDVSHEVRNMTELQKKLFHMYLIGCLMEEKSHEPMICSRSLETGDRKV